MKKYILLLLLGLTATLNAQEIDLQAPLIEQVYTNWCGIATSQCVLRYHRHFYNQCNIMEYVRGKNPAIYGYHHCCFEDPNLPFKCNAEGIYLGVNNEQGSIKDILEHFGSIRTNAMPRYLDISEIRFYLSLQRPIILQLFKDAYEPNSHAVVISKIDNNDVIYIMDPADPSAYHEYTYNELLYYYGGFSWQNTLVIESSTYPYHCYNKKQDRDLGELGVDCGGQCKECETIPYAPLAECANCTKNPNEVEIDCGGEDCPPCGDVLEEIIITNTTQLSPEVVAYKKITASGATTVASGKTVKFITEEDGSIVLLPGFKAEGGSNFNTQRREDLSGHSRICDAICPDVHYLSHHHSVTFGSDFLRIYNLLYAVEIEYRIHDSEGIIIYRNTLDIAKNGKFELWDCVTGTENPQGTVWYYIIYEVLYCNGVSHGYPSWHFYVNYPSSKSSTKDSEEPDTPPQFSHTNPNNTPLQSATAPPNFVILPNPNSGSFQLEANFPLSDIAHIKITNLLGVSVYETQNVTDHTIQLQNSESGMFFVVMLLKDGNVLTQKMVIQ